MGDMTTPIFTTPSCGNVMNCCVRLTPSRVYRDGQNVRLFTVQRLSHQTKKPRQKKIGYQIKRMHNYHAVIL